MTTTSNKGRNAIPLYRPEISGNEWNYVKDCLDTGWVSAGKYISSFESAFAAYVGAEYAVACSSGTAALHLALLAAGVKPGDRVLVPTMTFIATANAVTYCGAVPIFVDSHPKTWTMDPSRVARAVHEVESKGGHVSACIPVDLYGHPADIAPILELANRLGFEVVGDSTEALGSKYGSGMVGSMARLACFSFNGNKIITTGGGGMIVTSDKHLAARVRYLGGQARDDTVEYVHDEVGFNYRLTNVQAALGLAQLERIGEFVARKREIARSYRRVLETIPGVVPPPEAPWAECNFWTIPILLGDMAPRLSPLDVIRQLGDMGIEARPFFRQIHRLPPYAAQVNWEQTFEVAEHLEDRGVLLPSYFAMSDENIDTVSAALASVLSVGSGTRA